MTMATFYHVAQTDSVAKWNSPGSFCSSQTMITRFFLVLSLAIASRVYAIEAPPEEDPTLKQRGPIYSGCIRWRNEDDVIGYKGIVITLGKAANAYVCYD